MPKQVGGDDPPADRGIPEEDADDLGAPLDLAVRPGRDSSAGDRSSLPKLGIGLQEKDLAAKSACGLSPSYLRRLASSQMNWKEVPIHRMPGMT
jgi:hypothetical protein